MKILILILISFNLLSATKDVADFNSLCNLFYHNKKEAGKVCQKLDKFLFNGSKEVMKPLDPVSVGADKLKSDKYSHILILNDPNYFSAIGYCYFVYRGWIELNQVSPDLLSLNSSGFSIGNEDIDGYKNWLKIKDEGKKCEKLVTKTTQVPIVDLKQSIGNKKGLVIINPLGSVNGHGTSFDEVIADVRLTLNHERIHAMQVACPNVDLAARDTWLKVPLKKKQAFAKKHPHYDLSDIKVGPREYQAYTNEKNPKSLEEKFKQCGM